MQPPDPWPPEVELVVATMRAAAVEARLEEFAEGTPTAADAAYAIGCDPSQIVKSLVFVARGGASPEARPVVALVPGDRRADTRKVQVEAGAAKVRQASHDEVRVFTGFPPGGVAPFPLPRVEHVLVHLGLLRHARVWVGAGSPRHMAGLGPADLVRLTRARPADIAAS